MYPNRSKSKLNENCNVLQLNFFYCLNYIFLKYERNIPKWLVGLEEKRKVFLVLDSTQLCGVFIHQVKAAVFCCEYVFSKSTCVGIQIYDTVFFLLDNVGHFCFLVDY